MAPRGGSKRSIKNKQEDGDNAPRDEPVWMTNKEFLQSSVHKNSKKRPKNEGDDDWKPGDPIIQPTKIQKKQTAPFLSTFDNPAENGSSAASPKINSDEDLIVLDRGISQAKKHEDTPPTKKNTSKDAPETAMDEGVIALDETPCPAKKQTVGLLAKKKNAATGPKGHSARSPTEKPEIIDLSNDQPPIVLKKIVRPTGGFPRYADGDVYIELKYLSKTYSYQLHRGILSHYSTWFKEALTEPWDDLNNRAAQALSRDTGILSRFELFRHPESDIEVVQRTYMVKFCHGEKFRDIWPQTEDLIPGRLKQPSTTVEPAGVFKPMALQSCLKPISNGHSAPRCPGFSLDGAFDIPTYSSGECKLETVNSTTAAQKGPTFSKLNQDKISGAPAPLPEYIKAGPLRTNNNANNPVTPTFGSKHIKTETFEASITVFDAQEVEDLLVLDALEIKRSEPPELKGDNTSSYNKAETENYKSEAEVTRDTPMVDRTETEDARAAKAKNEKADSNSLLDIKFRVRNSDVALTAGHQVQDGGVETGATANIVIKKNSSKSPAYEDIKLEARNVENRTSTAKYTPRQQEYIVLEKQGREQIANPRPEILDAYNNLFLIYYAQAPLLNFANFDIFLEQIEHLTKIAVLCGSMAVVTPYLESALSRFEREIPHAILEDPPRWLMLSLRLKSAGTYREAAIHLAARYPFWPPSSQFAYDDIPERVRALMEICWNKTALMKSEIDNKLFCNSIAAPGEGDLTVKDKAHINSWFVVQFWRNWFIEAVKRASAVEKDGKENEYGTLYRLIAQGGEDYLPFETVMAELSTVLEKKSLDDVDMKQAGKDLTLLKKQAQEIVAPLCVNNSMLSVREGRIKYLTCYQIDNEDLPWIAMPDEFGF